MFYGLLTTVSDNQNGGLNVWLKTENCDEFSVTFCDLYRKE
jgi:hypothetical protein